MLSPSDRPHPSVLSVLVEGAASFVATGIVLFLPLHYIGSHLCAFGECSVPGPGEIRTYRILVAVLAVAVVTTLGLAVRRRARGALAWHGAVALAAVASSLLFAMPSIDWSDLDEEPPAPGGDYVPCYSGPPNDCPGG